MINYNQTKSKSILFFGLLLILGCKTADNSEISNFDYSYQKKWIYFNLNDTIKIKVIEHIPAQALCGIIATASITIGTTDENDTIRIINLCDLNVFEKGKIIEFEPFKKPTFNISLPLSKNIFKNNISNKLEFQPSFYDLNILKTTYGSYIRN